VNVSSVKNFIYGYIDPRNGQLRYVGLSSVGITRPLRFTGHAAHCLSWIKNLKADNLVPEIEILEEYPDSINFNDLGEEETWYIAYFKSIGCDLTNIALGGNGNKGLKHTPETKAIIGAATVRNKTGTKHKPESKLKMRLAKLGKTQSLASNLKRATSLKGRKQPIELVRKRAKSTAKPIVCVQTGQVFMGGAAEAARTFNLNWGNIGSVLNGRRKHTGGYSFKYYTPNAL
jgi:hypothetical protein